MRYKSRGKAERNSSVVVGVITGDVAEVFPTTQRPPRATSPTNSGFEGLSGSQMSALVTDSWLPYQKMSGASEPAPPGR